MENDKIKKYISSHIFPVDSWNSLKFGMVSHLITILSYSTKFLTLFIFFPDINRGAKLPPLTSRTAENSPLQVGLTYKCEQ